MKQIEDHKREKHDHVLLNLIGCVKLLLLLLFFCFFLLSCQKLLPYQDLSQTSRNKLFVRQPG